MSAVQTVTIARPVLAPQTDAKLKASPVGSAETINGVRAQLKNLSQSQSLTEETETVFATVDGRTSSFLNARHDIT